MANATVYAENGGKVKMRLEPSTQCMTYWNIPSGTHVNMIEYGDEWSRIATDTHEGYMMTKFLMIDDIMPEAIGDVITVDRQRLERVYDELGDILGLRG